MRSWRQWATGIVIALMVGALYVYRSDLQIALRRAVSLSPWWSAGLLTFYGAGSLAKGAVAAAVTPELSIRHGILVQQATTAANNTVIGGGPVSTGLRIAMLRSWGVGPTTIGVAIVALNVVAAYAVWTVALATAVVGLVAGTGGPVDPRVLYAVVTASVTVLTGSTLLWWVLLREEAVVRWLAGWAQRALDRVRRRVTRLPELDVVNGAELARTEADRLTRAAWGRILGRSLVDQLVTVMTPVVVVRAVGITGAELSVAEVLVSYGLVRLAAAVSPIPGGLGVTEFGLVSLLTEFGGGRDDVLTAVLLFRALTFVLPITTGALCFAWWRWAPRWSPRPGDVGLRS